MGACRWVPVGPSARLRGGTSSPLEGAIGVGGSWSRRRGVTVEWPWSSLCRVCVPTARRQDSGGGGQRAGAEESGYRGGALRASPEGRRSPAPLAWGRFLGEVARVSPWLSTWAMTTLTQETMFLLHEGPPKRLHQVQAGTAGLVHPGLWGKLFLLRESSFSPGNIHQSPVGKPCT